jgi:hypothetical protein
MGNSFATLYISKDIKQRPLNEFIKYDNYIRQQMIDYKLNKHLPKISSLQEGTKITFRNSTFDSLSHSLKNYYINQIEESQNKILKNFLLYAIKNNNSEGIFLPDCFVFFEDLNFLRIMMANLNVSSLTGKEYNAFEIKYVEDLFAGIYDKQIEGIIKPHTIHIDYFKEIVQLCKIEKRVVCTQVFTRNRSSLHAISVIFYWKESTLYFYIYDPMYYERPDSNYVWSVKTAYIHFKLLANEVLEGDNIQIINLSKECLVDTKGQYCVQYKMDAEYCYIYSMYFLFLYGKEEFPTDMSKIKELIHKTYIIEHPTQLQKDSIIHNNEFMLITMSFILNLLIIICDDVQILEKVKKLEIIRTDNLNNTNIRKLTSKYKTITFYKKRSNGVSRHEKKLNTTKHVKRGNDYTIYKLLTPNMSKELDHKINKLKHKSFESNPPNNNALEGVAGLFNKTSKSKSKSKSKSQNNVNLNNNVTNNDIIKLEALIRKYKEQILNRENHEVFKNIFSKKQIKDIMKYIKNKSPSYTGNITYIMLRKLEERLKLL